MVWGTRQVSRLCSHVQRVREERDGSDDRDREECPTRCGASSEEILSGGVQRQQDPDRRQQDQRRDEILRVGGDRRPDGQRRNHEEGLLDSRDLPFSATELHEQPGRQDDADENAVAEIGDGPSDALHFLEPGEDEGM